VCNPVAASVNSDLPQQTLNYAPICIGIVSVISVVGWFLPFGLGGMYWFKGPKKTIEDLDAGVEKR
jgi:hypothetical protein